MTINEIIELVDAQRPNAYEDKVKITWLDQLDRMAWREVFATHEDAGRDSFDGYTEDQDGNTELLIPNDHKLVYLYWLQAMIDFANQEMSRYTNSMTMFNAHYGDFQASWNRTHMPIPQRMVGTNWRVIR